MARRSVFIGGEPNPLPKNIPLRDASMLEDGEELLACYDPFRSNEGAGEGTWPELQVLEARRRR